VWASVASVASRVLAAVYWHVALYVAVRAGPGAGRVGWANKGLTIKGYWRWAVTVVAVPHSMSPRDDVQVGHD
jgi:hypothetical protein